MITKISNYLTQYTFPMHSGNLPLKEIAFNEFKSIHTKAERPNHSFSEHSFLKGSCFKMLNIL